MTASSRATKRNSVQPSCHFHVARLLRDNSSAASSWWGVCAVPEVPTNTVIPSQVNPRSHKRELNSQIKALRGNAATFWEQVEESLETPCLTKS